MLDFMRRQRSSLKWVYVILIFIFSVTLITLYIPFDQLGSVSITGDVASVGAASITTREFQAAYRNYLDRMRGQVNPETLRAFGFERQIMDALITRQVVLEEARRLGLSASNAEVEQRILANPAFREAGKFIGQERYQAILAQNNLTVIDFETMVRNELMQEKLMSFVTAAVSVSDKEVEQEYRRRNEKAKLDYFVIDAAKLEDRITMNEQEQRDYFEKNQGKYTIPEKRQAKYIFVSSLSMRPKVTTSDDELRQYYDQHRFEYDIPERVTAQHILFRTQEKTPEEIEAIREKARGVLERARKGEDFASLAKQFSDDGSASIGGDLGSFGRGQMVPAFEQAAFSLGPGAIGDLVQTEFGIHIIKVNDKQEARARPFEELKEAIRPIVSTRKAEDMARDAAQQVAVEVVNNKDLDAVAKKFDAEVKDTPLMEQSEPLPDLGDAAELQRRMFMMAKGEIGTSIQVERGYVIPMLTEIAPAHPASFEEARTRVEADVRSEKARQLAAERANQIQEQIKAGRNLAAVAKSVGAETQTSELLTRGSSLPEFGPIVELDNEIFSLPIGKPGTPTTISGRTLAFAVREREDVKPDEMKQAMNTLRHEILPGKREQYFGAYIQEVRKRMRANNQIEINEAMMAQIANSM
jgi:peptidyl-prolyl cis-trans isomerase D